MTDVWSERAEAYRESDAHREGRDLELFAEWAEGQGQTALDVATGGGNVARILRDAGLEVVTIDSAPGMQPTVVSRAEEIPFADSTFDVVARAPRGGSLQWTGCSSQPDANRCRVVMRSEAVLVTVR